MTSEYPEIARRLIKLQLNDTVLCQQGLLNLGQKSATEGLAYLIMGLYSRIRAQSSPEEVWLHFFCPKSS